MSILYITGYIYPRNKASFADRLASLLCIFIVLHPLPREGSLVCPLFLKSNQLVPTQGSLDLFAPDAFAGWTRRKGSLDAFVSVASAGWTTRRKGSLDSFASVASAGWTRRKGSLDSFVSVASAGWTRRKGSLALSLSPVLLSRSCVPCPDKLLRRECISLWCTQNKTNIAKRSPDHKM